VSGRQPRPDVAPPEFFQLAGHPLRWRLLAELARSDHLVSELCDATGEPQNLVSYHLGKLRDARLVSARRSAADGRDAYYTADLARIGGLLSATGGALHPGLRFAPRPTDSVRLLARSLSGGVFEAYSAGSHPKPMHPNAVRVMRDEHGLDLRGLSSKHLDVFAGRRFDWVISLCDRVREVCPEFPGHPETIHWSMPNPADGDADDDASYPLFQQTAAELVTRIGFLLAVLRDRTPARRVKRTKR